jgi:hypothetical protein
VNGVYLFEEPDEASAAAAICSLARNSFNLPRRLLSLHALFKPCECGQSGAYEKPHAETTSFMYILMCLET